MTPEGTFDGRRLMLDLSMYRQLGFYQLLDPNGPRAYGYHVYGTVLKLFLVMVQFIVIFAVTGFFFGAHDSAAYGETSPFEIIIILTNCTLSSLKMYILVTNADVIWSLYEMACADFLRCVRHDRGIEKDLVKRWERSTTITNLIARSFLAGMLLWFCGPFVNDGGKEAGTSSAIGIRYKNVVNARYPVTVNTYNRYYSAFYLMEVAVGFCIVYGSVMVDAFLMSFCWIISAQYQSVATAFEKFEHDETDFVAKKNPIEVCNDFKSIIIDHQNVYLKMKSFYAIVRPITLIHVFAYSCSLITYTYVIVMIVRSDQSAAVSVEMMKIAMTVSNVTIEVFIFCYLFELVNGKKEAVNFGLYSCNWTAMDIEFKKLLLVSMQMNNANRLKLKATPNITVDRPFFAQVIHTCFKIVSVLIQTQSKI